MNQPNLDQWNEQTAKEVSVEELDSLLVAYQDARADYDEKNQIKKEADAKMKEAQAKLVSALTDAGKKSWEVEGLGKATIVNKFSITTPKDFESKKQMLQHFRDLGPEVYLSKVSVNSRTLNAYFNEEKKNNPEFTIPGVGAPTTQEILQFRKSK